MELDKIFNVNKNKTNSMGPIKSTNGKLLLEDKDKVKEFNKYFASVFGEEDNTVTYIPKVFDPEKHKELNDLNITEDKVEQKIKNLNSKTLKALLMQVQ